MKIPVYEPEITEREINYVIKAMETGWISSKGPFVNNFQESFANWIGSNYAVSTSNGTTAIHLAIEALGIGKGDEVLVPNFTFISTVNAVHFSGAKPILVDIEKETFGIDVEQCKAKLSNKTKAIIPVHIYGHPAKMDSINDFAEDNNLFVIEDAAEALGSLYRGKKVGTLGDVGCFSFYGNKTITTGEGGMLVSNNEEIIERAMILRDHGMSKTRKYWHECIGFNYRMTSLQAAFGLAQMERIDDIIRRKRDIAKRYKKNFESIDEIEFIFEKKWAKSTFWMNSILLVDSKRRDSMIRDLEKNGIETRPFFNPINEMPPYYSNEKYPVSEDISRRGMNLPSSAKLSKTDVDRISDKIIQFISSK
ncbi:MAG: DegT/DnrJ/EryC1/StrS family aminotransferase [Candidatus Helarchaeota archaeon]